MSSHLSDTKNDLDKNFLYGGNAYSIYKEGAYHIPSIAYCKTLIEKTEEELISTRNEALRFNKKITDYNNLLPDKLKESYYIPEIAVD